ncbi:MAG: helix-turn-helix domain-containing protein [Myxococcota bacterium]|jgi:DNA-binding XRE family transcriptional regulator
MVAVFPSVSFPGADQFVVEAAWSQRGLRVRFADGCVCQAPAADFRDKSPNPPTRLVIDPADPHGLWVHFGRRKEFYAWDWLRHYGDAGFRARASANMDRSLAHVADRVRHMRAELDVSQQVLADRAGVSRATIARLEGGRGGVTLVTLENIARAAGRTFDEAFGAR